MSSKNNIPPLPPGFEIDKQPDDSNIQWDVVSQTPTPAPELPPGGQAGLQEGATGTGSDGRKYVVKGGVWVAQ